MPAHIIVVGSLNMDLVVRSSHHPQPGETIIGGTFSTFPGGKGANQAVAAARLGARVQMVGAVGEDAFGSELLGHLGSDGIDHRLVRRDPQAATGVALITIDAKGQNTIVVASGANLQVTAEDVAATEAIFQNAALLLIQLECPLPAVAKAIELAKKHGLIVVLNPAPAQPLSAELLSQVDYLVPNQIELAMLTGYDDIEQAVAHLRGIGVRCVVVTLGEDGVLASSATGELRLPAHQVTVVDTTAAGDAFAGGLSVGLAEGLTLAEALALGNAAGALAVTRAGAQPSLPTRAEVNALIAHNA
jgi:ribokinase